MGRNSKKAIARIMALLMAFTLLPFDLWGTANVVMAEESSEEYAESSISVDSDSTFKEEETDSVSEMSYSALAEETSNSESEEIKSVSVEEVTNSENEVSASTSADDATESKKGDKESSSVNVDNTATENYVHNFTTDGKNSSYYAITGNLATNKGTVTYNGLTLTQCLKIESSTNIKFTAEGDGTLTLVFVEAAATIKIDGTKYTASGDGIIIQALSAGDHTISKADTANLFYMVFAAEAKEKVATPTASLEPSAGEVNIGDTITLSCATDGAVIYYTTDGSDPGTDKNLYTGGITIGSGMVDDDSKITIKACAVKDGYDDSAVASFTYKVSTVQGENQLEKPTASPDSGEVAKGTEVTLKSDAENVSIYYTLDGTSPSKEDGKSILFKEETPIMIEKDTVIKAIATAEGKDDSFVASFTYTIKKPKVVIDEDSKSIINTVETIGDLSFINQNSKEIFNVVLKAKTNASPSNAIQTKAESLKESGGEILYYDFTLANADEADDTVTIAEDATGRLNIKMPYSISAFKADKRNEIIVLHNEEKIEVTKESDGFRFLADSFSPYTVVINPASAVQLSITKSAGYEEGAYAEWGAVDSADGYMAYVAPAGGKFERIDDELIREYSNHWRVDTVGLAKGTYYIKIDAVTLETKGSETTATVIATSTTDALKVTNYDRSGFAFSPTSSKVANVSSFGTGSGAYNDDGTLKEGAQVIYVTAATAKTCKAILHTAGANKPAVEVTGLQAILDGKQKSGTEQDILDIRIIGCITRNDLDSISSSEEGLQIKGKSDYNEMNITLEGIGEDAVVKEFGFLLRNCCNVELRNFAIMAFMDDGVSLDTANKNIWVHDLDIFYGSTGGDSDQAKGDGSVDVKEKSTFITISYNHFWDSGKCSLCGMGDSEEFVVTYHHNWFDHSDSRHPRIRVGSIHVYNNYYDGNSKYGVGVTKGSSAFVEANYFRNCKYPMLISRQASDMSDGKGTFSGEDGGIIKAYNNAITGAKGLVYANAANGSTAANATAFDAYLVSNRSDKVPSSVVTLQGGTSYNNFDTNYDLGVAEENIDAPMNVPTVVMAKAGRLNGGDFEWNFNNDTEDENYGVVKALKDAVVSYNTSVKKIGSGVAKNVTVIEDSGSNTPGGNTQAVNPPTASRPSGEVPEGTEITLSSNNSGDVKIYYTLNGLEPTAKSGTLYTTPIVINSETTIKAIAVVGSSESSVATFKYTIPGGTTPTPPPSSGGDDQNKIVGTYEFNPEKEKLTVGKMPAADTKYGTENYFTIGNADEKGEIKALSSSGKTTTLSGSFKSDLKEYSIRYQFGGKAAKDDSKAIRFHSDNKANIYVAAYRTADTTYNLYLDTDENVKELSRTITQYTFNDVEEGDHSIYAKDGNIAILFVIVEEFVPNDSSGDEGVVESPTAAPNAGNLKKGDVVRLSAAGEIYYTMTTDGNDPAVPTISDENKYTDPITITADAGATVKIKAIAVSDGKSSQPETFTYTIIEDVSEIKEPLSKPEANPAPEEGKPYPVGVKISLTSKERGTIYYTLDGTNPKKENGEPSETSKVLAENETITLDTPGQHTIQAFAAKEGYPSSETETFTYTVSADSTMKQLSPPVIEPASKEVEKGEQVTVTITIAEGDPSDTEIYYTTDGEKPVKDVKLRYTKPFTITVDQTTTINAVAIKDGMLSSTTASVTYTAKNNDQTGQKADGIYIAGLDKQYDYTGAKIIPDIEVWDYFKGVGTLLAPGVDYTVAYKNNTKPTNEAEVIVTGKGNYKGKSESKKFKIVPVNNVTADLLDLKGKGAKIKDKIQPQVYNGEAHFPAFTITFKDGTTIEYIEDMDSSGKSLYKRADGNAMNVNVAVSNNINKGTATILVTGADDSKGKPTSVKTTFKITPADISGAKVETLDGTYAVNGGAPASLKVTINLEGNPVELKKGKDYTVKYSNNKNAGTASVTVTGKGNYANKCAPKEYKVEKLDLSTLKVDSVTAYAGIKAGKVKATIADQNGNVIALNPAQYALELYKVNEAADGAKGAKYEDSAELPGEEIYVIATAKDETNLESNKATPEAVFKVGIDISKAKFKLKKGVVKEYTGNAVILDGSEFDAPTIKVNGQQVLLTAGIDYTIESYSNNVNKGTATAVIKGIGAYSGTKTVKFKITQKTMKVDYVTPWDLWKNVMKSLTN